jgi:hypothetical protein
VVELDDPVSAKKHMCNCFHTLLLRTPLTQQPYHFRSMPEKKVMNLAILNSPLTHVSQPLARASSIELRETNALLVDLRLYHYHHQLRTRVRSLHDACYKRG